MANMELKIILFKFKYLRSKEFPFRFKVVEIIFHYSFCYSVITS